MHTAGRFIASFFVLAVGTGNSFGQPLGGEAAAAGSGGELVQQLPREGQNSPVASFRIALAPADAKVGDTVTLTLSANVQRGWHIYPLELAPDVVGLPTKLAISARGLEPLSELAFAGPDPQQLAGAFGWSQQFRVSDEGGRYSVIGSVEFQACNEQQCMPPRKLDFEVGIPTGDAGPVAVAEKPQPPRDAAEQDEAEVAIGAPMVVALESCSLTRTRPQLGNIASLLLFGRGTDEMVWKGSVPTPSGEVVAIYLPQAKKYTLNNTGATGTIVDNTATYLSIDQDGDGKLAEWEACAADRPLRIHDAMYRLVEINVKNKTLTLQQLDMPLRGSLVGRKCPDFEFTTIDGQTISDESIKGTVTVLDIWAVTCHNCYEGFPVLERMREKHSPEKLQVILLSTDTNRAFYDEQAPGLFEQYGGQDWPQVLLPEGFRGALVLGDYGFGSVVVDEQGIVRAVGVHKHNAEAILEEVLSGKTE